MRARWPTPDEVADRARRLGDLHTDPALLVLVNVWDVASATAVAGAPGCRAVATASAAIAAAHGFPDGERIPIGLMLDIVGRIAAAVDLPVTADLESGYGDVADTVRKAITRGVAGANLEDRMRPRDEAVQAIRVAAAAAAAQGVPLVLNARTDAVLMGSGPTRHAVLVEARERGQAYLEAGAACVFVPGRLDAAEIATLVEAFGPGRLSLLGMPGLPAPTELEALGVARLSYGPYPYRRLLTGLADLAGDLLAGEPFPG